MPIYADKQAILDLYGDTEVTVSSDHDATGATDNDAITSALKSASREIESHALPYGIVPTDVAQDASATAGTFPYWWTEACIDIALYRLSLNVGPATKEKRKRYEDWVRRLEQSYPSVLRDGDTPMAAPQKVVIVGVERQFSASKVVGL